MRLKKVKDAKEIVQSSPYFVAESTDLKHNWQNLFANGNPISIEIGMGKGKFIIEMAKKHPECNFIGLEKYDSVMVKAVKVLSNMEFLPNLKLFLLDAKKINDYFESEIDKIYLNFSDPWPKSRHEKRRLTSTNFLRKYDSVFKNEMEIIQKTDNSDFFSFSCESLKNYGYNLIFVTDDLYSENDESNIPTEYEEKFHQRGVKIHKLIAKK